MAAAAGMANASTGYHTDQSPGKELLPIRPGNGKKPQVFSEVAASLYPWDIHDEGIENILDNLQEMSSVNSVYLLALMHKAPQRPLFQDTFPHNPVRDKYHPEDSRIYWFPDSSMYGRIEPRRSDRDWLRDTDWLDILINAARKRNLKTGAELSHTYIDSERAGKEFSDCVQHNIFGERLEKRICYNSPHALEYATGLFSDLTKNYDVDFVQTCLVPFYGCKGITAKGAQPRHLFEIVAQGGCFCESCKKTAAEHGYDLDKMQMVLMPLAESVINPTPEQEHRQWLLDNGTTSETAILLRHPEIYDWMKFRQESFARYYQAIHNRLHKIRPGVELRLNLDGSDRWNPEFRGVDLKLLKPHIDSIRVCDYGERMYNADSQEGILSGVENDQRILNNIRYAIGEDKTMISGIDVRPPATPETVSHGVVAAIESGANGISIGHYDGATFERMRAIRKGLEMAGINQDKINP